MLDTRTKVGPYGLLKKLGEGPHGTTWMARRDGAREPQALKILHAPLEPPLAPVLAALEADVARLGPEHPNVVVPAEAGLDAPESGDDDREPFVFLASELVDGPDLLRFTARAPWSTILEVVVSALRGLEALHARGLVHGHVVANNIIVAGQGPRKTARLLDPGLAREVALTRGVGGRCSWAPEALRGEPVDRRADLYDLGVLLFECATREPLFGPLQGEELVRAHLAQAPRKARELKRSVPVAVEAIIDALLAKDPASRPPSANAVIRELNRSANKRFSTETREARLPALLVPRFVGRQEELDELRACAQPAQASAGAEPGASVVALSGELGAGRTRLLQELRRELVAAGGDEAPWWLQPRAPTARDLVAALVGEGRPAGELAQAFARLQPFLRPLLPAALAEQARPPARLGRARERQRLVEATAALLLAAARLRPLVLVIDDAQRSDLLLVDVLRLVARDLQAARAQPALAGAGEEDEGDEPSALLEGAREARLAVLLSVAPEELYGRVAEQAMKALLGQEGVRELSLEPLDAQALSGALASALGRDLQDVRALVQRVVEATGGGEPSAPSPALHALADLAERHALPPPDGAWSVDDAQVAATLADASVVGLLRRRLETLRREVPAAARLLALLAAREGPAEVSLLARALDQGEVATRSAARELERRGLALLQGAEPGEGGEPATVALAQAQLADAVCQALDEAELEAAHEALGRAAADAAGLPGGDPHLDALAARHLLRSARGAGAAGPWALAAGRAALERHEPGLALELVEPVVRALEAGPAAERAPLLGCQLVLAEALLTLGKAGQARTAASKASTLAHEARAPREMAQALLIAQEAHRALREPGPAKTACEEALRLARAVDWRRGVVLALRGRALAEEAMGDRDEALASLEEARRAAAALDAGEEAAGVLREVARLRLLGGDVAAAVEACERAIELDEESEPPGDLAASLRLRAEIERARGDLERATDLARRALAAAREACDPAGVAQALGLGAELLGARGDRAQARARLEAALALWERIGDTEGAAEARLRLGRTLLAEGRLGEAEEQLQGAAQAFKTMNQRVRTSEATTSLAEAHLLRGDITRARDWADRALEEAKGAEQARVHVEVQRLRADVALAVGDLAGAEEQATAAAEAAARAAQPTIECQARIALGLARLRRGRLVDAERDLRDALELARERGDPALGAQARLAIAQVHLVRGEPAGTLGEVEKARDAAQDLKDAHLEAQSLIALGRVHVFLGQTRRAGQLLDMARQRAQELDLGLALADATLLSAEALLEQAARAEAGDEEALGRAAALLDEAERHATSRRGLRAEIDLARAELMLQRRDATGARERAEAALEASRITGDAIVAARAEALLAAARREQGRAEEALSTAERAVAAAEAIRDGEARALALLERGRAALALGQALPAAQDLREAASHIRGIWAALPEDLRRDYQDKALVRAIVRASSEAAAAAEAELQARPPAPPATLAPPPSPAPARDLVEAATAAGAAAAAAAVTAVDDGGARPDTLESLRDPLTNLFNHTFFTAQLETEIKRCLRHARPLALLKVNIDRFKLVRELYGPKVGKRVIRDIAQVLLRNVRDVDLVARYFGDEFEVLLPDTDQRGALLTAERIRAAVEGMRFEHEDEKIELTLTIGVAVFPRDAKDKDALICRVDEALYNARSRGSNTVFSFGGPEDVKLETSPELREVDALMLSREGRTILSMLQRLMNQELDIDRMIELVTGMVVEATRGERGFIMLKGADGQFSYRHGRGIDDKVINSPELKISNGIAEDVARTGEPIHVSEAVEDERFKDFKSVMDLKLRSIICAPIKDKDEVLGVIYVDHNQVARNFTQEDLNFLCAIAQKVAIPLKNSKLLRETVDRLEVAEARLRSASAQLQTKYRYDSIIGRTEPMLRVFKLLDRIVETSHSVVIHGESGTGKELIARAIHYNGPRKHKPFVAENCAALSDTLLEAELFGHVKGAFTGADRDSKGLFELANGGTLFLDEIGDMSERMQKKLLRVLQEGEVRPVGGKRVFHVDVRIISASNKDLKQLVAERKFREDLYYRLNVITVNLPPLRERRDDIVLLVEHFLKKHGEADQPRTMDRETLRLLVNYDWPGNVRELENEINRLVAMSDDVITPDMLSPKIREGGGTTASKTNHGLAKYYGRALKDVEHEFMRDIIIHTLEQTNWHRTKAAKILKVPTSTLFNKMKKYGIG